MAVKRHGADFLFSCGELLGDFTATTGFNGVGTGPGSEDGSKGSLLYVKIRTSVKLVGRRKAPKLAPFPRFLLRGYTSQQNSSKGGPRRWWDRGSIS